MRKFKLLFAAFVVALLSCSCDSKDDPSPVGDYNKVDLELFKQMIDSEVDPQILDCRPAADYAAGHIPGAINIDGTDANSWELNDGPFMTELKANFKTGKKIFIYGTTGWSGNGIVLPGRIASIWKKPYTYNLESGFEDWIEAGYDVEK